MRRDGGAPPLALLLAAGPAGIARAQQYIVVPGQGTPLYTGAGMPNTWTDAGRALAGQWLQRVEGSGDMPNPADGCAYWRVTLVQCDRIPGMAASCGACTGNCSRPPTGTPTKMPTAAPAPNASGTPGDNPPPQPPDSGLCCSSPAAWVCSNGLENCTNAGVPCELEPEPTTPTPPQAVTPAPPPASPSQAPSATVSGSGEEEGMSSAVKSIILIILYAITIAGGIGGVRFARTKGYCKTGSASERMKDAKDTLLAC